MESSPTERRDFIPYPINRVVGTVTDAKAAHAAIDALLQAGFDRVAVELEVAVAHAAGREQILALGKRAGALGRARSQTRDQAQQHRAAVRHAGLASDDQGVLRRAEHVEVECAERGEPVRVDPAQTFGGVRSEMLRIPLRVEAPAHGVLLERGAELRRALRRGEGLAQGTGGVRKRSA